MSQAVAKTEYKLPGWPHNSLREAPLSLQQNVPKPPIELS